MFDELSHHLTLAMQGLLRNRVQAGLAMLGMMVGVAALVTSLALGRGAQEALDDQMRAAGANLLLVTAGNYQVATDPEGDGGASGHGFGALEMPQTLPLHGAEVERMDVAFSAPDGLCFIGECEVSALTPAVLWADDTPNLFTRVHYENDPFAVHDHPTAAQRLGDSQAGLGAAATLTREDAAAIAALDGVQYVVSGVHENARLFIEGTDTSWFTRMHGTEADLPNIRSGWTMVHGRFLTDDEIEDADQVAVLGRVVADELFGPDVNPVGQTVVMWNQPFEVVGVVGTRSWATAPTRGDNQFDAFYVPVTAINKLLNVSMLNSIAVSASSIGDTTRLASEITGLLRERHGITDEMPDDFNVQTVAEQKLGAGLPPTIARVVAGNMENVDDLTINSIGASLKRTNRTIVALLAGVAAVSLLVGGIGVMNLLLLSVTQRTREVGLRLALGARKVDISRQFLLEAVLLSTIGGLAGIVLGVAASGSMSAFFQYSAVISPLAAVIAVVVAIILGVIFGVYPARRAAQLTPIEALRHE